MNFATTAKKSTETKLTENGVFAYNTSGGGVAKPMDNSLLSFISVTIVIPFLHDFFGVRFHQNELSVWNLILTEHT